MAIAYALNLTLTRLLDASARSTREVRKLEGGEGASLTSDRPGVVPLVSPNSPSGSVPLTKAALLG